MEVRTFGIFVLQNIERSNLRLFIKQNIYFITLDLYKILTLFNVLAYAVQNFYQAT
jgi:flagellar biogenesis protein FliO